MWFETHTTRETGRQHARNQTLRQHEHARPSYRGCNGKHFGHAAGHRLGTYHRNKHTKNTRHTKHHARHSNESRKPFPATVHARITLKLQRLFGSARQFRQNPPSAAAAAAAAAKLVPRPNSPQGIPNYEAHRSTYNHIATNHRSGYIGSKGSPAGDSATSGMTTGPGSVAPPRPVRPANPPVSPGSPRRGTRP